MSLIWRLSLFFLCSAMTWADSVSSGPAQWRYGGAIGYGGMGVHQTQSIDGQDSAVDKSEGPGVLELFIDRRLTERATLGIDHGRGFRFGPASSGVSFTGLTYRWFFWKGAPFPTPTNGQSSTIFVRALYPFIAFSSGLAAADITRHYDKVTNVTGTGVYAGFRIGFEIPMNNSWGIRPEMVSEQTIMPAESPPTSLSAYALQCGFYFYF